MIEVKYNIDFSKALKELESNKLFETLNEGLSHKVANTSKKFIIDGKVKPVLPNTNPRKKKDPSARPLFDTGNLAGSLKGSKRGITANKPTDKGIPYRSHRESSFTWKKPDGHSVTVPQREFIVARSQGKLLIRGTSALVDKIYKEFNKKFNKLLYKSMTR
tara:strand:- start:184 stop:666 length:483 start_codon:yes stop_codon:yes gene_type:complete